MNGRWVPCLVVAILAMSVIANIILIRSAVADPSFVIEPDYYREAVAWDSHMAGERASAKLGWQVSASLRSDSEHKALLKVTLFDAAQVPLDGVKVRAVASPNLCAEQRVIVDAIAGDEIDVGPACPGLWRIDVEAIRGDERFAQRLVTELGAAR